MGNSLKVMLVDDEVTILEGFKRLFDWKAYGLSLIHIYESRQIQGLFCSKEGGSIYDRRYFSCIAEAIV